MFSQNSSKLKINSEHCPADRMQSFELVTECTLHLSRAKKEGLAKRQRIRAGSKIHNFLLIDLKNRLSLMQFQNKQLISCLGLHFPFVPFPVLLVFV